MTVVQPLADETFAFNGQGSYGGMPQEAQSYERSTIEVLIDDWLRDPRDVERRKIIKRQSFEKRHSLADSLLIAKSVIDGHAKNKKFEKKASERRRVIKSCGSALTQSGGRRTSFADEIQTARSVIVPAWDYKESLERSKEKCRTIKDTFAGKRRPSLLEEIGVAKNVIVDSEKRKYELPPAVVEEVSISSRPQQYIIKKIFCSLLSTAVLSYITIVYDHFQDDQKYRGRFTITTSHRCTLESGYTSSTKMLQNEALELYATFDYSIQISNPNKRDSKRKLAI